MRYPKYTFLTYGSYDTDWWKRESKIDNQCSQKDFASVLNYSLAVMHFHKPIGSDATYYQSCYDATLTLALALNKSLGGTT